MWPRWGWRGALGFGGELVGGDDALGGELGAVLFEDGGEGAGLDEADVEGAGVAALGEDWWLEGGEQAVAEGEGAGGGRHCGVWCGGLVGWRGGGVEGWRRGRPI